MKEKLTNYDPAEDLGSDEAIAAFMAEAFQTNDAGYISHALGVVARAKGLILDGFGCGLFAANLPWTQIIANLVHRLELVRRESLGNLFQDPLYGR